jgi:replication factor A1
VPLKLGEVVDLIVSKSDKSKDEVLQLIEAKKKELDGYVTDEGAASLVARELNLDLFDKQPTPELKLTVRDLVTGMTGVSLNLKILRIFPVKTFQRKQGGEGKVASVTGSDSTGSIRVTFWNTHTQPIENQEFDEGDILRIINGRVRTGLGDQLEIHLGGGSRIMVNPPDVDPKDFPEASVVLTEIKNLKDGMMEIHVQGEIAAKYRITTFSRGDSEGTVASLAIRDATGQTRLVLWDEQSEWFNKLAINDTILVESGYVKLDRNSEPELHLGRRGRIRQISSSTDGETRAKPSTPQPLKDLKPDEFAATVGVVVIENQGLRTFTRRDGTEGKRLVFILADDTGRVRAVAWGAAADGLADVKPGTKLLLEGVSCRPGLQQELELHINESTQVTQNPPDMKIQTPSTETLTSTQLLSSFQILANVTEGNNVTVRGTIVQIIHQKSVYDSCPKCYKKVTISDSTITCPKCGTIKQSEPRLIAKIVIDDGTENIRTSFFGKSAERLFGMTGADAKALIEQSGNDTEPARSVEEMLLGKEVILSGRISLNDFSNELELSVNTISDVDPIDVANQLADNLGRKTQG